METGLLGILWAEGVMAREAGATLLDNPCYRAEHLAEMSEEEFKAWDAKARAWERGWRSGPIAPPSNDRRGGDNAPSRSATE